MVNYIYTIIKQQSDEFETIQKEVLILKQAFDNEEYEEVIDSLSLNKSRHTTSFSARIEQISDSLDLVSREISEISQLNKYLLDLETKISRYETSFNQTLNEKQVQLGKIQNNAKEPRITETANSLYTELLEYGNQLITNSRGITLYTAADQGKHSLEEMRKFYNSEKLLEEIGTTAAESLLKFNNYWDILTTQYYTIVVKHSSSRSVDYVTEDNPAYREWIETETYTDIEYYTERVYVGSRIVNDKKEDIYETVTKTRPVTKKRQVTRNNGESRTRRVAYEVYHYYYTLEKTSPGGITREDRLSGKKYEKYDADVRSWNYAPGEEIGYTVWKQLWNDEEGIKRGKNLKPALE